MQEPYILYLTCNPGSLKVYSRYLGKRINVHMIMNTENAVNIQNISLPVGKEN